MKREEAAVALASLVLLQTILPAVAADKLGSPRLVLKNNSHFLVLAPDGTMTAPGTASRSLPYGFYKDDTRYLCGLSLKLDGRPPRLVQASTEEGFCGNFLYRALDGKLKNDGKTDAAGGLIIKRELVIQDGLFERITIKNESSTQVSSMLTIDFDCDFKDMFEVRGQKRKAHGSVTVKSGMKARGKQAEDRGLFICRYTGLDGKVMTTSIEPAKHAAGASRAVLQKRLVLPPRQQVQLEWQAHTSLSESGTPIEQTRQARAFASFQEAKAQAEQEYKNWQAEIAQIECDDPALNKVFQQARRDLFALRLTTERGPALAAGLPWYAVPFGRDQIITARQILPFAPAVVKGLLKTLAAYQGKKDDPYTEETAGKIMHELRSGEMARNREIPFLPYYGTIDATPLWIVLLGEYFERTEDRQLLQELAPNLQAAISYLKTNSSDTYLYYGKKSDAKTRAALTNQAWKDSGDSVMHKDGTQAEPPIAICEVQGYLYQAWKTAAALSRIMNDNKQAMELEERAARLKEKFHQDFSMPSEDYFALAQDATSQGCRVVASNAGHLLSTGILDAGEEVSVVKRLMKNDMFSGWGIRTLSSQEKAYDPESYHNGSVWPHDNAIIVKGISQISETEKAEAALKIITALLEVAKTSQDSRLPELFCGYGREPNQGPRPYPVSCVPQAWCVGSIYQMVQTMSGLSISRGDIEGEDEMQARCLHPQLPSGINTLTVRNLKVGKQPVDLVLKRDEKGKVCASFRSSVQ